MPPERSRARVTGGELAYLDVGEGRPVVLVHGFPTSSFLWRRLVGVLASRFRVIAPDLLGYGDSDKPDDTPLDLRAQAAYLRELIEALGLESPAVVGHGFGGGIAQLLALEGAAGAIVLLAPVAFDEWPPSLVEEVKALPADQELPAVVRAIVTTGFDLGMARRARLSAQELEEYVRPWDAAEGARAFFRAARGLDGLGLEDTEERLAGLDVPMFVIWGEEDVFLSVLLADRFADAIPAATVALLPGCGHFVTEDATETLGPWIYEWLRARYLEEGHAHGSAPVTVQLERPHEEEME